MKKVKIFTIILAIILITMIAFGGIYVQKQNRMENKVKDYELGRELKSQRVVELKIKEVENDSTNSEEEKTETAETTESSEKNVEELNESDFENAKKVMEKRLQFLGATDYTISLNKEDGTVRVELPENNNTDMYIYYLYASQKITLKDEEDKKIILDDDMIKKAKYSYVSDAKGAYQVYEEIELTKDGQAKLNELLNDYALLSTEVTEIENAKSSESTSTTESTTENTSETNENSTTENTETTTTTTTIEEESKSSKKVAKVYVISKGKITLKIGSASSNTTSVNNNISKAAEIAMLENAGKLKSDYEVNTNRYEYSSITQSEIMYFAMIILAILVVALIVLCIIYKKAGILASIAFIGFLSIFSLLLRYTNVVISLDGISAIIIIMIINFIINKEILAKTKKINLVDEAVKATYKNVYLKLIPVGIITIVFCLAKWESLSSFGMIMFWGLILTAIYNFVITRTLLKLRENK